MPVRILFTGTSSFLPVIVFSTAGTARLCIFCETIPGLAMTKSLCLATAPFQRIGCLGLYRATKADLLQPRAQSGRMPTLCD
jgi:hypothetical protein